MRFPQFDKLNLGCLFILFCWPFLLDWTAYTSIDQPLGMSDLVRQYIPFRILGLQHFRDGDWNFWLPEVNIGSPYIGAVMDTWWYPTSLLAALLPLDLPIVLFFNWQSLLHLVWLSWGMFCACRTLGTSRLPALLAGLSSVTSGPIIMNTFHIGVPFTQMILSWIPWIVVGTIRWFQTGSWLWVCFLSLAFGCQCLAGMVQYTLFSYLLFSVMTLMHLCAPENRVVLKTRVLQFFLILILSAGLGTAQLYPTYEFAKWSVRNITGAQWHKLYPTPVEAYWNLLFPSLSGVWQKGMHHHAPRGIDTRLYISILWILLSFVSICRFRDFYRHPYFRSVVVFAVISVVVAAGDYNPVSDWISSHTPLWKFRANGRILDLFLFLVIILGAWVLDQFMRLDKSAARRWLLGGAVLSLVLYLLGTWHTSLLVIPERTQFLKGCLQEGWLLAGAALIILALALCAFHSRFKWLLPMLLLLYVIVESHHYRKLAPPAPKVAEYTRPDPLLMEVKEKYQPTWRYRVQIIGDSFVDAYPLFHGFFNGFNFMSTPLAGTRHLIDCLKHPSIRRMLGIQHVWTLKSGHGERAPVLENAVYEVTTNALPPVYIVEQPEVFKTFPEMKAYMCSDRFDPAEKVCLLSEHMAALSSQAEALQRLKGPPARENTITNLALEGTTYSMKVELARASAIVLSQAFYPRWQATIGNEVIRSVPGNLGLNIFLLPEGTHHVQMRYNPQEEKNSALISLAFLICIGTVVLASVARKGSRNPA